MKKLFIGLLIVIAAGAGVYFYLQKNKKPIAETSIQKEQLIGKWKLDTLSVLPADSSAGLMIALLGSLDSSFSGYHYDFQKEGSVLQSVGDSVTTDTSFYEWKATNEFLWREARTDSSGELLSVIKLNADSLVMRSKDSVDLVFTKLK
jgi:hypothetical protein